MNFPPGHHHVQGVDRRLPFHCIALVLQGGGALGAYQGGVYEALVEANIHPDWVAGISIGAINAAIIAGNPPDARLDRVREFWTQVTSAGPWCTSNPFIDLARSAGARNFFDQVSASFALVCGATGFFSTRTMPPWSQRDGTSEATSFYDTSSLKMTLERLVDFDRLNAGKIRFSAGAVNVRTGNVVYFDNSTHTIMPEHIMASGALPPGFPAIEIDGEHYWDGGLVSNTPLEWLLQSDAPQDMLAFQVDVWSPRGPIPRNMAEVATRQKEIQYSSRTRPSLRQLRRVQQLRRALAALLDRIPEDLSEDEDVKLLRTSSNCHNVYNIVQLTYRAPNNEGSSKDYEFSRVSMQERWRAGYKDALRVLRHPEVFGRPTSPDGVFTFHLDQERRE